MLLTMGISLYTSRLILEALGVDDFGLYAVVAGIVSIFGVINGALVAGSSRFITFELGCGDKDTLRKTFSVSFSIHALIAVIVLFLAETVGLWYVNTYLVIPPGRLAAANWVYQFSIISIIFSITQVPYSAIIIAYERMKVYAWVGMTEALFKLLMVFFLLHLNSIDKLIYFGLLSCVWSISLQVYYRFYCNRNFPESKLIIVKEKAYYTRMLSFSLWDLVGYFCASGNAQGVNLLINYFFGVAVNAARGVAYQVENAMMQFSNNFMTAVRPQIVKLYAVGRIEKMLSLVFESSKYSYFLLYIVSLPVFFEADYILSIWLKKVPDQSTLFLRCVIIIGMIRAFASPVIQAVHATGNIKWLNLYAGGAAILLTIPATYLFYKWGYPAVVSFYIVGATGLLCNFLELYTLKKEIPFSILKYVYRVYGPSMLITVLSAIPIYYLHRSLEMSFYRLFLVCTVDVLYVGLLVFFIGVSAQNRQKIVAIVKNKITYYVNR